MRYDIWPMRIVRLFAPLGIYFLIGLLAMGSASGYDMTLSLPEKLVCACVMSYLFIKDNRIIVWKKNDISPAAWIITLLLAGIGGCIGINYLFSVTGLTEFFAKDYGMMTEALYRNNIFLEAVVMVILAPLAEELLFRGILFRRMRTYCSYLAAALVTSLLFAVVHGNMLQGIYGFFMGFAFSWAYEQIRTIFAPILFHAAANACSLLATECAVFRSVLQFCPWITMMLGIFLFVLSLIYIKRMACRQKQE